VVASGPTQALATDPETHSESPPNRFAALLVVVHNGIIENYQSLKVHLEGIAFAPIPIRRSSSISSTEDLR